MPLVNSYSLGKQGSTGITLSDSLSNPSYCSPFNCHRWGDFPVSKSNSHIVSVPAPSLRCLMDLPSLGSFSGTWLPSHLSSPLSLPPLPRCPGWVLGPLLSPPAPLPGSLIHHPLHPQPVYGEMMPTVPSLAGPSPELNLGVQLILEVSLQGALRHLTLSSATLQPTVPPHLLLPNPHYL